MPASAGLTCLAALLQEQQDAQSETSRQMNAFEVCVSVYWACACLPFLGVQIVTVICSNTAVTISCGLVTGTNCTFNITCAW